MRAAAVITLCAIAASVSALPATGQDVPEGEQLRGLLTCVGDAAIKGAAEEDLRGSIAHLCALAHAPVTQSCPYDQYLFDMSQSLCEGRDLTFWGDALYRAYLRTGRQDEVASRIDAITKGCAGVEAGPAAPVGCVTDTVWREWASVTTGDFLDILAAEQAESPSQNSGAAQ